MEEINELENALERVERQSGQAKKPEKKKKKVSKKKEAKTGATTEKPETKTETANEELDPSKIDFSFGLLFAPEDFKTLSLPKLVEKLNVLYMATDQYTEKYVGFYVRISDLKGWQCCLKSKICF